MNEGQRKAAVLLHSMHPDDRALVLSGLTDAQRADLTTLITEIEGLGITPDAEFVTSFLTPSPSVSEAREPIAHHRIATLEAQLRGADSATLLLVLQNEPVQTAAILCGAQDWPWKSDLLTRLGPIKRRQATELMQKGVVPHQLYAALLFEVCAALSEQPVATQKRSLFPDVLALFGKRLSRVSGRQGAVHG